MPLPPSECGHGVQEYALSPITVFENVSYGLKIAGLRGEALRQKVEKVPQIWG